MSVIYIDSYQFAAPVSYDPDAAAYIARIEGASGDNQALETAVKNAINAFVVGCKADGIWSAIKHACIMAGARTLNGALQPLITGGTAPTNVGFIGAGTDYSRKTGLKGDGTKYLNTNVKPSDGLQNNLHFSTYTTSVATSANVDYIGAVATAPFNSFSQIIDNNGPLAFSVNMVGGLAGPAGSGNGFTGFFGAERSTSLLITCRYGGVALSGGATSVTPCSLNYFVFCRNLNGTPNRISDRAHTFYSIGESLNLALLDARVTTLINAYAAAIP